VWKAHIKRVTGYKESPILHPSNFIEGDRPSDSEVEAAARELHGWGALHGWWPEGVTTYDAIDSIGKDEFDAIVERVLMSAAAARRGVSPKTA
jgi:hypothetical protein